MIHEKSYTVKCFLYICYKCNYNNLKTIDYVRFELQLQIDNITYIVFYCKCFLCVCCKYYDSYLLRMRIDLDCWRNNMGSSSEDNSIVFCCMKCPKAIYDLTSIVEGNYLD